MTMPARHGRHSSVLRGTSRITAAVALLAVGTTAAAERGIAIGSITGRDFAGINLPTALQERAITLASDRAWAWSEGATTRIALEGDVRVSIGPQHFRAARAVAWFEPILATAPDGADVEADQVAIVFEGVTAAGAAPDGPAAQNAERLLVTGIVHGPAMQLKTDLLRHTRPTADDALFVDRAEARLAKYLTTLIAVSGAVDEASALAVEAARAGDTRVALPPAVRSPVVPPEGGTIAFSASRLELSAHNGEDRVIELRDGLSVQFVPPDRGRTVLLQAERGVVFLSKESSGAVGVLRSEDVLGIYIEGDASITDGQYTLRGARMYYDPTTERAVVLDAVFFTWDERRGMPLYLRADTVRQSAQSEWKAEKATLANASLAEPHFSIGVDRLSIRLRDTGTPEAPVTTPEIEAEGVRFRAGDVPMLGLPKFAGEVRPSPLRDVRYSNRGGDSLVSTRWDLFTLLNREAPREGRLDLLVDGYLNRGPALGVDAEWEREDMTGESLSYGIFDNGTDRLSSGARIEHDDQWRGMFTVGNIWRVSELWTLTLEGSYISDETFVDAFFEPLAETRREFTNSVFAKRQTDQDQFSLEVRGTFNDFISNEYLLQSQGYVVENLPEAKYARFSDQIFDIFSYSSESSVGYYEATFSEPTLAEYGFNSKKRANAAFGLPPSATLAEQLDAQGFPTGGTGRFDTRHEIEAPMQWGAFNIVPFAVARATWWSQDFDGYNGSDGLEDDGRIWSSAGVRTSTSIVNVNNELESRVFDLHRMRHIIEPYATGWVSGTNVNSENLPVYDEGVEPIVDGAMVNLGIRQTWQTERGPVHNRRSVDWLMLDMSYTWSSDDTPRRSPFGRFLAFRPELSNPGEFIAASSALLLTEAVTLVGEAVYDVDDASENGFSRGSAGFEIDHGDSFTTYSEYRYLRDFDDTVVASGLRYELSTKYAIALEGTWNLRKNRFQNTGAILTRRFPQWVVDIGIGFDETSDIFQASVSVRPVGFGGNARRRPFTYDEDFTLIGAPIEPEGGRTTSGPFRDE